MIGKSILNRLPDVLKRGGLMDDFVRAHDEEFDGISSDIEQSVKSKQVENAQDGELDEIGEIFGKLGQRRGRDDDDYRVYLKSVVQSFNGRGSVNGLKFAIASSIGTTPDNVEIIEDFENLEYSVQIKNVDTSFLSSAINDLAELADPSGVKLDEAIIVFDGEDIILVEGSSSVIAESDGLGTPILTLDGTSTLG